MIEAAIGFVLVFGTIKLFQWLNNRTNKKEVNQNKDEK